jgi:hypothetical protein
LLVTWNEKTQNKNIGLEESLWKRREKPATEASMESDG